MFQKISLPCWALLAAVVISALPLGAAAAAESSTTVSATATSAVAKPSAAPAVKADSAPAGKADSASHATVKSAGTEPARSGAGAEVGPGASGATEDVVRTNAGIVYRGKVTQQNGEKVVIETASGPVEIPAGLVANVRLSGVDYRAASEKIDSVTVPENECPQYVEKAKEALKKGDYQQTVAIYKGLMAQPKSSDLSDELKQSLGRTGAAANFELKDWKAAGACLRYSARATQDETDKLRLNGMAEAFEGNSPPTMGSTTVDSFGQAQQQAMKWKADNIFNEIKLYAEEFKEVEIRAAIEKRAEIAQTNLGRTELFVPGYSAQRWPEIPKAMAAQMLDLVDRGVVRCQEMLEPLMTYRKTRVASFSIADAFNVKCRAYLGLRQDAEDCLENVRFLETRFQVKEICNKERYEKLVKRVDDLKFWPPMPGYPDRVRIQLAGIRATP